MEQPSISFAFLLVVLSATQSAPSLASDKSEPAFRPYAELRYRLELVDQADLPVDATASTLRIKAGIRTSEWQGFSAQVEAEAITRIGEGNFNDTVNRRTAFPVVADPSHILLNQAIVRWRPVAVMTVAAGRQVVNFDNQRWIGSVGWRQNDQTLDAVQLTAAPMEGAEINYIHAWRVNRVFGSKSPQGIWRDTDIHGLRAAYALPGFGTLTGYGYWLDIPSAPNSNSQTLGVRLAGEQAVGKDTRVHYVGEYARQTDYGANSQQVALDYLAGEAGLEGGGWAARVGLERLEGDGKTALQTPLATLHAFNGWADKFLVTPPDGLRDLYFDLGYRFGGGSALKGLALRAVWHDFNAIRGGRAYGQEWNAQVSYPVSKRVSLLAKVAIYEAASFASDTTKAWLSVETKF